MNYTLQLTEPVRIGIGKMLIAHEMVKLFPEFNNYDEIKTQINNRWGDFSDVVDIRDFWNLVDSIMMGFKLKDIVTLITTQKIEWELKERFSINELKFTWDKKVGDFEFNKKTVKEVVAYLEEHKDVLRVIEEETQREVLIAKSRIKDPIIVEKYSSDSSLHVHDGNGRLLKATIENQKTIDAYVGTQNNARKSNHWVSTAYLQRLSDANCGGLLVDILRESDNAVFEFENRVMVDDQFKQEVLKEVGS